MANLNPRFLISSNIQENFNSKETGLPLAGGRVEFYKDASRQERKSVFVLTGAPPNYEYLNIGSTVTLNTAGAASYDFGSGATDVKLYYNPFDSDGGVENYYVQAFDAGGARQLTREAWPDFKSSGEEEEGANIAFANYIPNGQFLSHNNLQDSGRIAGNSTVIALGNWTFDRPANSNSTDNVSFVRFDSFITNPESNPRYATRVTNTGGGGGEGFKDVRVKFDDVNRFSSADDATQYTFKFDAKANGGNFDVELILIKNYGTGAGASDPTETSLGTFSLTGAYQSFTQSFSFGGNGDKTLGSEDDDFLQLAVRLPRGQLLSGDFTNFALLQGEFTDIAFPETTSEQSVSQFLGGAFPVPDETGRDLFLHPRLTKTGWEFDKTIIGQVVAKSTPDVEVGELLADGSTYSTTGYSNDGIPYARLQEKYWDSASLTPTYGTGRQFLTAYSTQTDLNTNQILFTNNESGFAMAVADGLVSSGFIFNEIHETPASSTDYGVNAWVTADGAWVQNKEVGALHQVSPSINTNEPTLNPTNNTGLTTFGVANKYLLEGTLYQQVQIIIDNLAPWDKNVVGLKTPQEFNLEFASASELSNAGNTAKYWTYRTTTTAYVVWYQITNELQPSVTGHSYIKVNLNPTDDTATVAAKTVFALNNFQSTDISVVMASSVTAGGYFTADTVSAGNFYFWYTVDGDGDDPNVAQRTGIKIDVLSTDGAQQVAQKTISTINSYQFALPDYRGLIFKGAIGDRTDIGLEDELAFRFNRNNIKKSQLLGSEQLSANRQHIHRREVITSSGSSVISSGSGANAFFDSVGEVLNGTSFPKEDPDKFAILSDENTTNSRPANAFVNYVIKY